MRCLQCLLIVLWKSRRAWLRLCEVQPGGKESGYAVPAVVGEPVLALCSPFQLCQSKKRRRRWGGGQAFGARRKYYGARRKPRTLPTLVLERFSNSKKWKLRLLTCCESPFACFRWVFSQSAKVPLLINVDEASLAFRLIGVVGAVSKTGRLSRLQPGDRAKLGARRAFIASICNDPTFNDALPQILIAWKHLRSEISFWVLVFRPK